jgi:hypothetical protein
MSLAAKDWGERHGFELASVTVDVGKDVEESNGTNNCIMG